MQVFKYEPYSGILSAHRGAAEDCGRKLPQASTAAAETDEAVDTRYDAGGHQAWPQAAWQVIVSAL